MVRCTRRKTLLKIYSLINRRLRIYGCLSEWIQENYTQLFKLTSRQRYVVDESVSGVNASRYWDWDGAVDGTRRIPIDSIYSQCCDELTVIAFPVALPAGGRTI